VTAAKLTAALRPFGLGPAADGEGVEHDADCPAGLAVYARVLHTGLAAVLLGRPWWGCDPATGRGQVLAPAGLIPPGVGLLTVEGWRVWDRVPPNARGDLPRLFAAPPAGPARRQPRPSTSALDPAPVYSLPFPPR